MNKLKTMLIIGLLLSASVMILVNNEYDVKATGGGGEGENKSVWLDYDFMWFNVTEEYCNVVHNKSIYPPGTIPRGRTWGTDGDRWTANYTEKLMIERLGLTDVEKLPIRYINKCPYKKNHYSSKIEVKDFEVTIDNDNYPYENPIPSSEIFPIPKAWFPYPGETTYYHDNLKIDTLFDSSVNRVEPWPFAGTYNNYSLNLTQYDNEIDLVIGNVSYINISNNENVPEDHEGVVFIINDIEDETQSRIDNMTNASGCIIIYDNADGPEHSDTSNCSFSIAKLEENDDNQYNLTQIINLLESNESIIADNYLKNGYLTFTYNIDDSPYLSGDDHYFLFHKLRPNEETRSYYGDYNEVINRSYWFSGLSHVRGFFIYDSYETHFMTFAIRRILNRTQFFGLLSGEKVPVSMPGKPIFSINKSVGEWLINNKDTTTLDIYMRSVYKKQTEDTPGVITHNVVGYLNRIKSPDDKIVVISNRYDGGFWGEAAGDCALGGGIVLSIAKYLNDNDITPRYNLTFLMTTGEEYDRVGAYHFVHSHPNYNKDNCVIWIGADQFGFNQADTKLGLVWWNKTSRDIAWAIANTTNYYKKNGNKYNFEPNKQIAGKDYSEGLFATDTGAWYKAKVDALCLSKDTDGIWNMYQRSGMNYTEGDVLKNIDRDDANASLDLFWNLTKYYTVYTDCWLNDDVSYEMFDSSGDGDLLNDSISANFTFSSILPYETVMVNATLINDTSDEVVNYAVKDFTMNSSGGEGSISVSISDVDFDYEHDYYLTIKLYNSTERINYIVGKEISGYNDTDSSSSFHLYHPFGKTNKGDLYQNISNNITGSIFKVHEYGIADNITAYINKDISSPGPYKCMFYRLNDSKLIGTTTEDWTHRDEGESPTGWAVFSFSEPKPVLRKDTKYVITCWGDNTSSCLYYDTLTGSRGRNNQTTYQENPPDPINFTGENRLYSIYCSYRIPPEITNVFNSPDTEGYGKTVTISADVTSDKSSIDTVKAMIYKPEDDPSGPASNYTMTNTGGDTYEYSFTDTWQLGQYNYSIWAEIDNGKTNTSSNYSFNVSAQATVSVCTLQDDYGNNTWINVTDPPSSNPSQVGYEMLDDGEVLRIWNRLDSYYFDTNSGIQITNHYDEYWSHNVLMIGYYNNDQWNLIYRTDELSGFNKDITSGEDYVNATLWKDLSYNGYDFRLAIRYHLGADDNELTVIPYIKNIDDEDIPYALGFAWEIKDIQIDMTPENDYIEIDGTSYLLNQSLDETYKDLDDACFYIREDHAGDSSESLYLRWDEDLNYKVKVESREGQYNAPVTLGIKIGTLDVGQEKHTKLFWHDAFEKIYYFNSYNVGETWATSPGNMVDGSTSNYASTTTDLDVELCDGNNCSTSDLGVIAKVELRAYGYYSGYSRVTILRPVFSGTTDGFNYPQATNSTPSWSDWSDITNDPYAPNTWSWSDVENLDCDVESGTGYGLFTLYCAKVEIKVTYAPNNDPVISNPVPADESTGVSITPVLNITVSDLDGDNMNITWLSNSSGSWVAFGTNNSVGNGTYHQTFSNASVNGQWWYWKVNVTDGTDSVESSVFSFYTGYESKIKNTGSTNFSGYLLMQIQFYDEELEDWFLVHERINETTPRTINVGSEWGLDTIFNPGVETQNLLAERGNGTYRVYACFRDPDGDVLVCDDETLMEDIYEFTVTDT